MCISSFFCMKILKETDVHFFPTLSCTLTIGMECGNICFQVTFEGKKPESMKEILYSKSESQNILPLKLLQVQVEKHPFCKDALQSNQGAYC